MAPRHGEILKYLDDGLVVAWDTTQIDRGKLREAQAVGREQAAELEKIIDDIGVGSGESAQAGLKRR